MTTQKSIDLFEEYHFQSALLFLHETYPDQVNGDVRSSPFVLEAIDTAKEDLRRKVTAQKAKLDALNEAHAVFMSKFIEP